jgi:succinate dehydrogenase flavin-adding protein (antitoxin of CptAB toxin-antitoxin module)
MRELDLLLEKFLVTGLQSLENDDLRCLEKLLAQPDQDILAWLTAEPEPDDMEIRRIVAILRGRIFSSNELP